MEAPDHPRLLVVEDEEHLAAGLKLNLEIEGYEVDVARNAREAGKRLIAVSDYDAIVLDVMLPDVDGFELCRSLREAGNYVPIIMLTARNAAEDRVRGLESGADDYMVKPFELGELMARVGSALRRRRWERKQEQERGIGDAGTLHLGERVEINFETHEARVEQRAVHLTRLELDLLHYFADHPGRVIGREELLEEVWKVRTSTSTRTVDNFISRLRRHFEVDPSNPRYFVSVRGTGYRFVP